MTVLLQMKPLSFAIAALAGSAPASEANVVPDTRRVNVVEDLHGVSVADPYRWLEQLDAPEVQNWARAQNAATEAFTAANAGETYRRLLAYSNFVTKRAYQRFGSNTFYLQGWAGSRHTGLYVEAAAAKPRRLAGMDVSRRNTMASSPHVAAYWPSPDGKLVLALQHGRDQRWGSLDLIDVSSGRVLRSSPNVYGGFTGAVWLADGTGYAYSAYEREGDAPVRGRIVRHDLADHSERVIFAAAKSGDGRQVLIPRGTADSNRLFIEVQSGSSGANEVHFLDPESDGPVKLFDATATWLLVGARGDDAWFFTTNGAANGRVVRVRDILGSRGVETIIAESAGSISATSQVGGNAYGLFGDRIALLYLEEAAPILRVFDLDGRQTAQLQVPPTGTIWGGLEGDPRKSEIYYQFIGVAEPSSIYRVNLISGRRSLVASSNTPVRPDDIEARRVFVNRGPGVRIPVLIAHRRGLSLEHPRRTIMYGYGAFGWVSFLWYQPQVVDWLLHDDGVFVVAGVRGGGEFGSAWHQAGTGPNRQAAIDDYVAVAQYLVDEGISRPDLLVANGGSASGGLAAAAVNQRPGLFGAVTLDYPALDLIRYPRFGAARYWADEFGSPDDPAQFRTLLATSPYHNVQSSICYPATLVRTGEHDSTVTPVHGFKFTALLQNANRCSNPVRLDIMEGAGHDYGSTPEQVARSHAVMLEFLRNVLPSSSTGTANTRPQR